MEVKDAKILLVDDEASFREILRLNLEKAGFSPDNIKEAQNGIEALEIMKSYTPDLVILDVLMSEKDGIETALEMKQTSQLQNIKFVFLTNYGEDILEEGQQVDRQIAQQIGALDFFRKTESFDVIVDKIKKILKIT